MGSNDETLKIEVLMTCNVDFKYKILFVGVLSCEM